MGVDILGVPFNGDGTPPEVENPAQVDVDALDPSLMPVNFPEHDGLTLEEAREFLNRWLASGKVIGTSVASYHPRLDVEGSSGRCLASLIADAFSI